MTKLHPVHVLQANLEAARLKSLKIWRRERAAHARCATGTRDSPCGPVCVREEIDARSAKMGWGDRGELE